MRTHYVITFNELKDQVQIQIIDDISKLLLERDGNTIKQEWLRLTGEEPTEQEVKNEVYKVAIKACESAWQELEIKI